MYSPTTTSTPATKNVSICSAYLGSLKELLTGRNHVAMPNDDSLWRPSGARCVHDARQIIGRWRHWLGGVLLAELDEFIEAHDFDVRVCASEGINVLLLSVISRA